MIRSQTVWSRTVPGTSSRSKPTTTGGAAQEPPTTALPPGLRRRVKFTNACSGERLARETIPSTGVSQSEISPCTTSTLGRSSIRLTRLIRSTRRPDRSSKTKRVSGITTLSGIPGRPTPEPTSRTRSGVSRNPPAKSKESPICRLSTRIASLGPIPPASTASVSSHSRYRSRMETRVGDSSRPAHSLHRAQRRWEGST